MSFNEVYRRQRSGRAFRVKLGEKMYYMLLDPYTDRGASLLAWSKNGVEPYELMELLRATESIAKSEGFTMLFIQTWSEYKKVFEEMNYGHIDTVPWLSLKSDNPKDWRAVINDSARVQLRFQCRINLINLREYVVGLGL
jgi:hypothetical protein